MTDTYRRHRERFLALLTEERAAAVIPTAHPKVRNHDSDFRFRPESDFWYLTGFEEPASTLVLLPDRDGKGAGRTVLFLQERDREAEIWNGRRLGVEAAPEALGVDEAYETGELWSMLPELLKGYERVVYRTGRDAGDDRSMLEVIDALRRKARGGVRPPAEIVDPVGLLHEQRLRKGEPELERMRRAAAVTTEAHVAAMAAARPGVRENEIEALLEYTFRRLGGTGAAYTSIVAGGANACILHYSENRAELRDGDLLLIDAGAEWEYYASDVTRTFPVNGTFSAEQRAIYSIVLEAQRRAIAAVRPGSDLVSIHEVALGVLVDGLLDVGLLKGTPEEVIAEESYKRFFMHRTGHWLGLDVHDAGHYFVDGAARPLEPGMVLTVEPGLYIAPDDEGVDARWRGIGVRIEDDVLVTPSGHENLTAAIPKEIDAVEEACQAGLASVS